MTSHAGAVIIEVIDEDAKRQPSSASRVASANREEQPRDQIARQGGGAAAQQGEAFIPVAQDANPSAPARAAAHIRAIATRTVNFAYVPTIVQKQILRMLGLSDLISMMKVSKAWNAHKIDWSIYQPHYRKLQKIWTRIVELPFANPILTQDQKNKIKADVIELNNKTEKQPGPFQMIARDFRLKWIAMGKGPLPIDLDEFLPLSDEILKNPDNPLHQWTLEYRIENFDRMYFQYELMLRSGKLDKPKYVMGMEVIFKLNEEVANNPKHKEYHRAWERRTEGYSKGEYGYHQKPKKVFELNEEIANDPKHKEYVFAWERRFVGYRKGKYGYPHKPEKALDLIEEILKDPVHVLYLRALGEKIDILVEDLKQPHQAVALVEEIANNPKHPHYTWAIETRIFSLLSGKGGFRVQVPRARRLIQEIAENPQHPLSEWARNDPYEAWYK